MEFTKKHYDRLMRIACDIGCDISGFNNEEEYDEMIPVADVTQSLDEIQTRLFDLIWEIANSK